MNSYYRCESGGRVVTVWPSCTGEAGFYDVVFGNVGDEQSHTTIVRITAYEAAAYVLTELGVPLGSTIASLEGMIQRWRAEYEAEMVEPAR